jgi:hypothetical protein
MIQKIPLEILQMTLRLVSRDALAPASLVCKTWRSIALPLLYQSVQFCQEGENRWQDVFLNRTMYGQEDGRLLSDYVNRLRVERDMDEEELGDFYSTVARMDKLEHLDWTVSILQGTGVDWYGTLVRLCQELPKLRSLSLTLAQNEIPLVCTISLNSCYGPSNDLLIGCIRQGKYTAKKK